MWRNGPGKWHRAYGCVLLFSDERYIAHWIPHLQKPKEALEPPTASGDRSATGRSKWPESPGWCSADCHSSRKPRGPRPRCERGRASSRPSTTGPAAWGAQLSVCKSRLTATSEPSAYLHWNVLLMKYPFDFMWGLSMPQTCRKHRILFTLLLFGKGWGE